MTAVPCTTFPEKAGWVAVVFQTPTVFRKTGELMRTDPRGSSSWPKRSLPLHPEAGYIYADDSFTGRLADRRRTIQIAAHGAPLGTAQRLRAPTDRKSGRTPSRMEPIDRFRQVQSVQRVGTIQYAQDARWRWFGVSLARSKAERSFIKSANAAYDVWHHPASFVR